MWFMNVQRAVRSHAQENAFRCRLMMSWRRTVHAKMDCSDGQKKRSIGINQQAKPSVLLHLVPSLKKRSRRCTAFCTGVHSIDSQQPACGRWLLCFSTEAKRNGCFAPFLINRVLVSARREAKPFNLACAVLKNLACISRPFLRAQIKMDLLLLEQWQSLVINIATVAWLLSLFQRQRRAH